MPSTLRFSVKGEQVSPVGDLPSELSSGLTLKAINCEARYLAFQLAASKETNSPRTEASKDISIPGSPQKLRMLVSSE